MAGYYDYVLALMPLTAVCGAGLLVLVGTPLSLAFRMGVALTLPLVVHALFVRTPDTQSGEGTPPEARPPRPDAGLDTAD